MSPFTLVNWKQHIYVCYLFWPKFKLFKMKRHMGMFLTLLSEAVSFSACICAQIY